ncbi:MAG: hypothetical protein JSR48_09815 [Verrucomicrobia bacterium]|nr:hypothetical protein [Verrucomicrobiota bacterium]
MKSRQTYLILLLALTTLTGGAVAWKQYQELIKLRASALSTNERADWQKRLWDSEKRRHELEAALADAKAKAADEADDEPAPAGPGTEETGPRRGRGGMGGLAAGFMAMMEKPEIQKLLAQQQRGALDARFAALFKSLNLSPEQLEKFKNLLVEKQTAIADVMAAARAQGIDPRTNRDEFRQLISDTQAEIDANIKSTLGDAGFAQYQDYQRTLPQRNTVTQLEQALSYTSTPLSSAQSDQLIQILAQSSGPQSNAAANRNLVRANFGVGFGGAGPTSPITDAAITQSQSVLAPQQVQALQQLQQQQQAQQQLAQAMRSQFRNAGGSAQRITVPSTPATPAAKPGG